MCCIPLHAETALIRRGQRSIAGAAKINATRQLTKGKQLVSASAVLSARAPASPRLRWRLVDPRNKNARSVQ
jgi:hypothetical protein